MEKENTELFVVVDLIRVILSSPSNYFTTLKLDFNSASSSFLVPYVPTAARTEVCDGCEAHASYTRQSEVEEGDGSN